MQGICAFVGRYILPAAVAIGLLAPACAAAGNRSYRENVVHSFSTKANCTDGEAPTAGLIAYGTTIEGGDNSYGTVFELKKEK